MTAELLVMAAGMGSRYGGLKQLDPVGPSGETLMDYSLYDACRAGVKRVVFVIRRDIEAAFRQRVGGRYERWMEVEYAFQELELRPQGIEVAPGRSKPWGTAHAVLSARALMKAPFLVLNADDFYGAQAFQLLVDFLEERQPEAGMTYGMVAFPLANTLSRHGAVARGLCAVDPEGWLRGVREHVNLQAGLPGIPGEAWVSMNLWGFTPDLFPELEARFEAFLRACGREPGAECFLPALVDELLAEGRARVKVLRSSGRWFGVTYREDREDVVASLRDLVARGLYPGDLWGERDA